MGINLVTPCEPFFQDWAFFYLEGDSQFPDDGTKGECAVSFEISIREAVAEAFQRQVVPLLQPVLEQMKLVRLPAREIDEELWTTRETAAYLKCSPVTVEMWRPDGRGPDFLRIGKAIRYKKSVVVAFAEANKGVLGRKGRPPQVKVEEVKRTGLAIEGSRSRAGQERQLLLSQGGLAQAGK